MKNKLPLLARLILLFLLVSSCQTEHDDVEPAKAESLLVQQARQHFETMPQLQHNTEA